MRSGKTLVDCGSAPHSTTFRTPLDRLVRAVERALGEIAPRATAHASSLPPIVGAALLGLDELESGAEAQTRLRRELEDAFEHMDEQRKNSGLSCGQASRSGKSLSRTSNHHSSEPATHTSWFAAMARPCSS